MARFSVVLCVLTLWILSGLMEQSLAGGRHKHNKQARRFLNSRSANKTANGGAWPSVFNLATKSSITTNATCGETGREEYCREHRGRQAQCGICDAHSPDPNKRHPIEYAIDGNSDHWWQSPSLAEGPDFEYVTVTMDFGQVYEVGYVIIRSGASPRPAAWALEHSIDGELFLPWQYFARSSSECQDLFGVPASPGKPKPKPLQEPTCTMFHSKMNPLESGEIHLSLLNSDDEWSKARWIRLRLLGLHNAGPGRPDRRFYTLKDLTVGGRCVCSGHANHCKPNLAKGIIHPVCECIHHTCGANCDQCCPMFNQQPYSPGGKSEPYICQSCQCYGHATECIYDEQIDADKKSIDIHGRYKGGGVCINCQKHTAGVNCEKCDIGYYRLPGVLPDDEEPCEMCDCDPTGSTGNCIYIESKEIVTCECREGYSGLRCDRCNIGYKGYPICEKCACNRAGTIFMEECNGDCQCKNNVEGVNCDSCKAGYFALDERNPDGCLRCYCSGVSKVCHSALIENHIFQTLLNWTVTDISHSNIAIPILDTDTGWLTIADYEFSGYETYYWNAPDIYLGNKLKAYGSLLIFRVGWVIMRGDTSGKPTRGPNIVIIGHNGMRIAFEDIAYDQRNGMLEITIPLIEHMWYHVPNSITDITTRTKRDKYYGGEVSRDQFMSIMANIKHLLLRAKFHTDQIDGNLEGAIILTGNDNFEQYSSKVEKCLCPTGYTGLSCEHCAFGYVKLIMNKTNHLDNFECIKCNCNGHAETCDLTTNKCSPCEHNTMGEKCERCMIGYYGNPIIGTQDDCKKCACPLLVESNNFSPSCALEGDKYFCTQCPEGYTGDHCEICDYGYYGNPLEIGCTCKICDCNGAPCNNVTGLCLSCPGNTEGFRCESCKENHYGVPSERDCKPCDCDPIGSTSQSCDPNSGKCKCKPKYSGRSCNSCQDGYGNMTAGCVPCQCNSIGSYNPICDPVVGHCPCRPGVEGIHCDACQYHHYGFSSEGCQGCKCNDNGSVSKSCDIKTGQCQCLPHVTGLTCSSCKPGYWKMTKGVGCTRCECDPMGTKGGTCDMLTGKCICHMGIGGETCDNCLPGYYGFSNSGCLPCAVCSPGQICDPDTGRCICPALTQGAGCNECRPGAWGIEPIKGCKYCNCSAIGSLQKRCDPITGSCLCQEGYAGTRCDQCAPTYYGYPLCKPCFCEYSGTLAQSCDHLDRCSCDENGQCPCKANVVGHKCNKCKDGTFGLSTINPSGCTQCFCFGRSSHCSEAGLTWGLIRINVPRELIIESNPHVDFQSSEISKISVTRFGETVLNLSGHTRNLALNETGGIVIIPETEGNVTICSNYLPYPLYWSLPKKFLGDRVTSYGGFLKFSIDSSGIDDRIPFTILKTFPLVQIHAHGILILEYYEILPNSKDVFEVRFHESLWRYRSSKSSSSKMYSVDRSTLMVALQDINAIYIRGTSYKYPTGAILLEASLDTAIPIIGQPALPATSVELCSCPNQYNATSCQDASIGFYIPRPRYSNASGTIIIQIIGEAQPCECNGRSEICDKDTGHCRNCRENTSGFSCEHCAEGHYGDPFNYEGCLPCPCPTTLLNHASSCYFRGGQPICHCKEGYTGLNCSLCARGWWLGADGKCTRCECNSGGVVHISHGIHPECHPTTGQCPCHDDVTGIKCNVCLTPRHYLEGSLCVPCDNCSQTLLDKLDLMTYELEQDTGHITSGSIPKPWIFLYDYSNRSTAMENRLKNVFIILKKINSMPKSYFENIVYNTEQNNLQIANIQRDLNQIYANSSKLPDVIDVLFHKILQERKKLDDRVIELENFIRNDKHININKAVSEAEDILRNIKRHNFSMLMLDANDCFDKANMKSALINEYAYRWKDHENKIENIVNSKNNWFKKIREINNFVDEISDKVAVVKQSIQKNRNKLDNIIKKKLAIEDTADSIDRKKNRQTNLESAIILREYEDDIFSLKHSLPTLNDLKDQIEENEAFLNRLKMEYINKFRYSTQKHADNLQNVSQTYGNLFTQTNDGAGAAIAASTAFQNIVNTIEVARDIADEALETTKLADRNIEGLEFSENANSLFEISEALKAKSKKLYNRASQISVKEIMEELGESNKWKEKIKRKIGSLARKDKDLYNSVMKISEIDIEKNYNIANNKTEKVYTIMKALNTEADNIHRDTIYRLKIELRNLQNSGNDKIGKAEEKVSQVRGDIKRSNELLARLKNYAQQREEEMKKANVSLAENLQLLKDQIQRAKHAADGIRISLKSNENKGCVRSYQIPNITPSTTSHITATISITPASNKDSVLFHLSSSTSIDFIKLEVVDRKILFSWNLGGDTAMIIHPETLEVYDDVSNDQSWYKIEVSRIWNMGKLTVGKIQSKIPPITVSNSSNSLWGILNVKSSDLVWVGGMHEFDQNSLGLAGCMHKLYYNGKQIGLWNFHSQLIQEGCEGCVDGAEEVKLNEQNVFYWNGAGYSVLQRSDFRPYNKNQFSILLTFRTLDENALLFLAVDEANNRSVSLQLRDGRVVFRIDYAGESRLEINTTEKYNNGKFVQVQATRVFNRQKIERGSLKVDGIEHLGSPNPPVVSPSSLPDLIDGQYMVGGTPPLWRPTQMTRSLPPPFLGCMGEISIGQETYNPMDSKAHYGVEGSCSNKPLTSVGFYGDGYLEIPSQTLNRKSHFGFMFRTLQPSSFLLLSAPSYYNFINMDETLYESSYTTESEFTFPKPNLRPIGNEEFYSVSLVDGKIHVLMNAGKGDLKLVSNTTFLNDGIFHAVSLVKMGRKIELYIDDNLQTMASLPPGSNIIHSSFSSTDSNLTRRLFLGGVPNSLNETEVSNQYIGSMISLRGAIKDIILDGKIIPVDNIVDMNHAYIGRLGLPMGEELEIGANLLNTQESEVDSNRYSRGCRKVYSYTLEPGAVKFGDKKNSYTQVQLFGRNIWQKDFTLDFDFRTFYPSGLLFIAPSAKERPRHFISLFLRGANVTLLIKGKRKKELSLSLMVNDGMWHNVSIKRTDRRLSLNVDSRGIFWKMPKHMYLSNMLYIGGVPEKTLIPIPDQIPKIGFRGCIRHLRVNGKSEDLVKNKALHENVGQCFPRVEMGSYFPGDAYAVYKNQFALGLQLELHLEFRTVEVNGVLLSFAHSNSNTAALSLELHNAKVIMSVLTASGRRFSVSTSLPTKFGLCDNTWHNISALFSANELAVRVDHQPQETDLGIGFHTEQTTPPSINQPATYAPLYIGGLPESAPSTTLKSKDNFKGCIRNVSIQGLQTDWTDMDHLHNVLLSSCPIQ